VADFDFGSLSASSAISKITDPATLFDALPNKAEGYGYLRAVQKTVVDAWAKRRDDRDLVMKTNTGGGKTIAGLLILQCCLNEGVAPALYIAPDPHLAERVIEEAGNLGLKVADGPDASAFLAGEAIYVTTMNKVVNGKTRFGLSTPGGRQPVKVGAVVVDDAHAALAQTEESTQLRIPKGHAAYRDMLLLFEAELTAQNRNALLDILAGDRNATIRIPFWAWAAKQGEVVTKLHPHRLDDTFKWAWPLIADVLQQCQAVVTADAVEIVPLCPPIEKFPSFHEADRRIYLTATLADDSVLVTHFDAEPGSISTPIVPQSAADLGDRLVIAPQELNPAIAHDEVRAEARALADMYNVVVLVPSWRRADLWVPEADLRVSTATDISSAVEQLKSGHVGLVVVVNRYDGIDLPDDACRLLIVDGLPFAYTGAERREAAALRDSDAMVTRQLQRLEQGIGRGVRSRDDRCVVLVLDPRLVALMSRIDIADRLSPATRAQLKVSRQVASKLEGKSMAELVPVIQQVIKNSQGFREISREALVGVAYGEPYLSPTAKPLRDAYNASIIGLDVDASQHAAKAVEAALAAGDELLAGWLGETLATYLEPVDALRAQGALASASERNRGVMRPQAGVEYKKVKASAAQAQQSSNYLAGKYANRAELVLGIEGVLADLVWDNERANDTEEALAELGRHLGFLAQRPERDFGVGSDVMWVLENGSHAVIEAKAGAVSEVIWKKDINQLAGSVNWCEDQYPGATVVPVMMHKSNFVERSGTPPTGTRVLNDAKLDALKTAVRTFAKALSVGDAYKDHAKVQGQLTHLQLTGATIVNTFTVAAKREK
jgi:hypothetical protein